MDLVHSCFSDSNSLPDKRSVTSMLRQIRAIRGRLIPDVSRGIKEGPEVTNKRLPVLLRYSLKITKKAIRLLRIRHLRNQENDGR